MAEVFSASSVPAPFTPIKAGPNVQTTEISPDSTPAPEYTKAYSPKDRYVGIEPPHLGKGHPVLPIGNVFIDIRNHLSCHSIFNANIETLLQAYLDMKTDLDNTRSQVAKLEREVKHERREKNAFREEAQDLKRALMESEANLDQTREELAITQDKLRLSVKHLMDVTKRLEDVKAQLRIVCAERDQLARELEVKEAELQHCKKRISELEYALALANKGESDANERNVRLTQLLYEVERQKAEIERARDAAEKRLRDIEDDWDHGSEHQKNIIAELRVCIVQLECQITTLTKQRDEALAVGRSHDKTIIKLNSEIKAANALKQNYRTLVKKYDEVVDCLRNKLNHHARSQFVTLYNNRACYIGKAETEAIQGGFKIKWSQHDMSDEDNVENVNDNDDSVGMDAEHEENANSASEPLNTTSEVAKEPATEVEDAAVPS